MEGEYRVGPRPEPIPPSLRESLSRVETATIGHFEPLGFVGAHVQPVFPSSVCGTAVTVAAPGRDGTVIYRAIEMLQGGDVLVISRVDRDDVACVGGGVATAAKARGAVAIVLDGPCTDAQEIRAIGLPVWCCGVSSKTTNRQFRIGGAVNLPVACGAAAVLPGFAVLADNSGVFVADVARMQEIAARALARQKRSALLRVHLQAGGSIFDFDRSEPPK
jgi:4-hydroxy-4-methyl-2-oxoglutarate aldolase